MLSRYANGDEQICETQERQVRVLHISYHSNIFGYTGRTPALQLSQTILLLERNCGGLLRRALEFQEVRKNIVLLRIRNK